MEKQRVERQQAQAPGLARVVLPLAVLSLLAAGCAGRDGSTRDNETAGGSVESKAVGGSVESKADAVQPDPSLPLFEITVADGAIDPEELVVPAGQEFQILLQGEDIREAHLLAIYPLQDGAPLLSHPAFSSEMIRGQAEALYRVPALEPGKYLLKDEASHASGELVVDK